MATLIPTTRGMTVSPTATRSGVSNPVLGQAPIVQTPTSPTATATNVTPTATGVGTVQNNVAVNQSTTPEGGFVPMVNTPFTQYQNEAMNSLANTPTSNPNMDWAGGLLNQLGNKGMDMFNQGSRTFDEYVPKANQEFNPATMITPYMNPYLEQVLNPTLERLRRERNITQSDIASGASRVGAFGGTREGVQRSLNDEAFDRNTAETTGNIYNTGWNNAASNALGQFNQERGRNLNTAQMGQGNMNSGATMASNAANNAIGLGQQQIGNYTQAAQNKLGVGGLQQQLQQKDLDAVNAELKSQQGFDMNRIKDLLSVLGGLPTGTASSVTKPGLEWSDILGGAAGAASQTDWTKLFSPSLNSAGGVAGNSGGTGIGVPYPRGINY